jgi:nitrogenase subunit NifH
VILTLSKVEWGRTSAFAFAVVCSPPKSATSAEAVHILIVNSAAKNLAVVRCLRTIKKSVISTEAAHGLIVNSAAEKFTSRRTHLLSSAKKIASKKNRLVLLPPALTSRGHAPQQTVSIHFSIFCHQQNDEILLYYCHPKHDLLRLTQQPHSNWVLDIEEPRSTKGAIKRCTRRSIKIASPLSWAALRQSPHSPPQAHLD